MATTASTSSSLSSMSLVSVVRSSPLSVAQSKFEFEPAEGLSNCRAKSLSSSVLSPAATIPSSRPMSLTSILVYSPRRSLPADFAMVKMENISSTATDANGNSKATEQTSIAQFSDSASVFNALRLTNLDCSTIKAFAPQQSPSQCGRLSKTELPSTTNRSLEHTEPSESSGSVKCSQKSPLSAGGDGIQKFTPSPITTENEDLHALALAVPRPSNPSPRKQHTWEGTVSSSQSQPLSRVKSFRSLIPVLSWKSIWAREQLESQSSLTPRLRNYASVPVGMNRL